MAALRLMIEAGEKPDRALVRLRALRPCAVETEEQLYWALDAAGATNARVFAADAVDVLAAAVGPASLDHVLLYFPDPWPKKRHHKRRIVQTAFADEIARVLRPGGLWRLATDWAHYAEHMRDVLDAHPSFSNAGDADGYVSAPPRAGTRFESRGRRKGHAVFDMAYRRRE